MAKAISKPLALAVAVGLTLGGSFGVGAPAFAQVNDAVEANDPADATQKVPGASTIPAGDNFKLTIHKRLNPTLRGTADGTEDENVTGKPLPGAEFEIQKLDGDIRHQAGFNNLAKIATEFNRTGGASPELQYDVNFNARTGTTGANGDYTFDSLPAGAYLVTETKAPQSANPTESFVKSKPYVIMVPMTNEDGDGWLQEVHTYPKNTAARVSKEVKDANKHAEDDQRAPETKEVEYTLNATVPAAPSNDARLTEFTIRDSFNNAELRLGEAFQPFVERIPGGTGTPVPIGNEFYQIQGPAEVLPENREGLPADANSSFAVVFEDAARAGLEAGDEVRVTFKATLLKAPDQEIENAVNESGIFRGPGVDQRFETPNDKVGSYIGNIRVIKVDADRNEKRLEGANFELYRCEAEDDIIQTGSTDQNGELTFEGIHVSDWVDGKAPAQSIEYCLRETEAPEGYLATKDEPYKFFLNLNSKEFVEGSNNEQTIRRVSMEIENVSESERPILPSTGGMGILLVALLGLGIIVGGVYAARRNSAKA